MIQQTYYPGLPNYENVGHGIVTSQHNGVTLHQMTQGQFIAAASHAKVATIPDDSRHSDDTILMTPHSNEMNPQNNGMSPHNNVTTSHKNGMNPHSNVMSPHNNVMTSHNNEMNPHSTVMNPHNDVITSHNNGMNPHSNVMSPHKNVMTSHNNEMNPHSTVMNPHNDVMTSHNNGINPHSNHHLSRSKNPLSQLLDIFSFVIYFVFLKQRHPQTDGDQSKMSY